MSTSITPFQPAQSDISRTGTGLLSLQGMLSGLSQTRQGMLHRSLMMSQKTITLEPADIHVDHGDSGTVFGFWLYLMTDCVIFAALFAVFAVMSHQFAGGPTGKDLFDIPGVALETGVLLLSSITYGFAMLGAHKGKTGTLLVWLGITFLLGLGFIGMEL